MSLVLSLCATTIPLNSVYIIKPYIFIELVIYSSSITQHAHTHTNTFFLSIFETPSHFAFTVSSLLVHQETDPQTTRVC